MKVQTVGFRKTKLNVFLYIINLKWILNALIGKQDYMGKWENYRCAIVIIDAQCNAHGTFVPVINECCDH